MNTPKILPFIVLGLLLFIASCQSQGEPPPTAALTDVLEGTLPATPTLAPPTPTSIGTPTSRSTPEGEMTSTITVTPLALTPPSEARLHSQCLEVLPELPPETRLTGILALVKPEEVSGYVPHEIYLQDMTSGTTIQVAPAFSGIISPDNMFLAYNATVFDAARENIIKEDLVISDASGKQLKVIPWEEEWRGLSGWVDGQRLAIDLHGNPDIRRPSPILVFNPFTGERQIIRPEFEGFFYEESSALPFWDYWFAVMYDPALTRAIYPRFFSQDQEMYTYGLWDLVNHRLIASFEEIFATYSVQTGIFPQPRWSPDGTQFIFQGLVWLSDSSVEFEMFRVSRDGAAEQLTHLTSTAFMDSTHFSWSPDGRYIAMYIYPKGEDFDINLGRVAVLDTLTLDITDYCGSFGHFGEIQTSPVWLADSTQFLVVDRYESDHQHVILYDIKRGIAARIAEDLEPIGWLKAVATTQP